MSDIYDWIRGTWLRSGEMNVAYYLSNSTFRYSTTHNNCKNIAQFNMIITQTPENMKTVLENGIHIYGNRKVRRRFENLTKSDIWRDTKLQ